MMRLTHTLILVLVFGWFGATAQEYSGVHTSPYLPFVALVNQPAELVRSDTKWNVNVLSAHAGFISSQSFVQSKLFDVMGRAGFGDLKFFLASEESLIYLKGRLMIPSVSYKLNSRHAFGFTVSLRADGVYNSSNDEIKNIFRGISDPEGLKDVENEFFKSQVNSWVEYAVTWSTLVLNTENRILTGGLTLKFLNGSGSGYLQMDGIEVMFDKKGIDYFDMEFAYGFNESLSKTISGGDVVEQSGDIGLGVDMGLSYSYRPDHFKGVEDAPYLYKLGFMVNDIGQIRHRSTKSQAAYHVTINDVPYSRFKGISTLTALKDSIEKSINIEKQKGGSFKTKLPLSLVLNMDYCIKPKFFVNGTVNYRINYNSGHVDLVNKGIWRLNLTGRYETKKWGVFLPLSHSSVLGWDMGVAMRYKHFFIGSSTITGNLFKKQKGQEQLYLGASIPIGVQNK